MLLKHHSDNDLVLRLIHANLNLLAVISLESDSPDVLNYTVHSQLKRLISVIKGGIALIYCICCYKIKNTSYLLTDGYPSNLKFLWTLNLCRNERLYTVIKYILEFPCSKASWVETCYFPVLNHGAACARAGQADSIVGWWLQLAQLADLKAAQEETLWQCRNA